MAITTGGGVRAIVSTDATPQITLTGVPAGATITVAICDRTGGMTVSDVSSDVDGTFGSVLTEIVHSTTFRDVMFRRHNCTAGTHVITGTLGAAQNTQLVACWADSDTGSPLQDDATGTGLEDSSADVDHVSTNATATSQPGVAIYLIETGNSQGGAPTALSSGTVLTTTVEGGMRSFLVGDAYTSTGAKSFTCTLASSTADRSLLALFKEASGSTTLSPSQAALSLAGRQGTINNFTNVAIREVLINEANSPVANRTGMSLLIWYDGNPNGAPDVSYSALTTDANGTASWNIASGPLAFGDPIFYVATDGGASLSQYTCARMVPTYT